MAFAFAKIFLANFVYYTVHFRDVTYMYKRLVTCNIDTSILSANNELYVYCSVFRTHLAKTYF